jgi:hypothetical protein
MGGLQQVGGGGGSCSLPVDFPPWREGEAEYQLSLPALAAHTRPSHPITPAVSECPTHPAPQTVALARASLRTHLPSVPTLQCPSAPPPHEDNLPRPRVNQPLPHS